ncbi:MAG: lipoprotein-releasing ABC transporter permease subunit [Pseudomonadota bacterium]
MLNRFERLVAGRYLKPQKAERIITVIAGLSLVGIALGVAALIIVMSVMNGFREELIDGILGVDGHAKIVGYGGELADYDAIAAKARAEKGVLSATPLVEGQVMATRQGRAFGALIRGISLDDLDRLESVSTNVVSGTLDDFEGNDSVAVGKRLAENLLLNVGDQLTIISPEGTATPFGLAPRLRAFTVTAIFEVGIYSYDNLFVFMPIETAQSFFKKGDEVSAIEIRLEDPDRVQQIAPRLQLAAGRGAFISTWQDTNQALFTALVVERNVMFWILTLIILVAAFNIISSLIMLVRAKNRDIAILRTIGASRISMMKIFVLTGATIGALGTLIGTLLGVLVTLNIKTIQGFVQNTLGAEVWNPEIRWLAEIPARMDPFETIAVVLIALVLTLLATLYPSWKAASTDPVEVLRYE